MKKFSYWTILFIQLVVVVIHYQAVFSQVENSTVFGNIPSWGMGIIFEAGLFLFLYFFPRIESGWKYFIMIVWIVFVFFFQHEYYATILNPYKRIIYAGVWPFMIIVFSFLGKEIYSRKEESGSENESDYTGSNGVNNSGTMLPFLRQVKPTIVKSNDDCQLQSSNKNDDCNQSLPVKADDCQGNLTTAGHDDNRQKIVSDNVTIVSDNRQDNLTIVKNRQNESTIAADDCQDKPTIVKDDDNCQIKPTIVKNRQGITRSLYSWNEEKQRFVCPYCGDEAKATQQFSRRKHDIRRCKEKNEKKIN